MATLTEQVQDLAADILNGHEERRAWLGAMREDVSSMRREWKSLRRERKAWMGGLRRDVGQLRKEFASDRQGAHRAWLGIAGGGTRRPEAPRSSGQATRPSRHTKRATGRRA